MDSTAFPRLVEHRQQIVAALASHVDVRGIQSGLRLRAGRVTDEPVLAVYVTRKVRLDELPVERRLPLTLGGIAVLPRELAEIPIDVVAQGQPRLHRFDHTDRIKPQLDTWRGASTISVLFEVDGVTFGLVSGHGLLPVEGGAFVRDFHGAITVVAEDADEYAGVLTAGLLDAQADSGLVQFAQTAIPPDTFHRAAQRQPPLPLRTTDTQHGDVLFHWSRLGDRGERSGVIVGYALGPIELASSHGETVTYASVITVSSETTTEPFSVPGDSGSLVVDQERRVVGTVIGGSPENNISYVLPIPSTATHTLLEGKYNRVFTA